MTPMFFSPWSFAALAAIPILIAIYWLRSQSRRYLVSNILLWVDKEIREGGLKLQRIRTPLLFFLELLVILLLVAAAARPMIESLKGTRPLIIIVDDSYSMLAGSQQSTREIAIAAIRREIKRYARYSLRFIIAGTEPQLLGEAVDNSREAINLLRQWQCRSPFADLPKAIAIAGDIGGSRSHILVVTDHAPPGAVEDGRVQWWACGKPHDNIAFVNAVRNFRAAKDRCLLEVANLSPRKHSTDLTLEFATSPEQVRKSTLEFAPWEKKRLIFNLPNAQVNAYINGDNLPIDDKVTLLPPVRRPVQVAMRMENQQLRALVEKSLIATKRVLFTSTPEMVFADGDVETDTNTWLVQFLTEEDASAYVGPFIVDHAHIVTEGLSLAGVIWGSGKQPIAGLPVVSAGNTPLVTIAERVSGNYDIRIRLRLDLSTVQLSANWPILLFNLVQWRAESVPGLKASNIRLGDDAIVAVAGANSIVADEVQVIAPDGKRSSIVVREAIVRVPARQTGRYHLKIADKNYRFGANAVYQGESDLTKCTTGKWGQWYTQDTIMRDYRSIAWILLLLAMVLLLVHLIIIAGSGGKL